MYWAKTSKLYRETLDILRSIWLPMFISISLMRTENRTFILGAKIYKENKEAIQYVRQSDIDSIRYPEMIIKLANTQNGIITKQDVAELLKVTPNQAYSYIKKLQKAGKLELVQRGKYSKYKLVE